MSLSEWTESDLLNRLQGNPAPLRTWHVLFYTLMCGTCKVANRMLEIVQAMDPTQDIGRCNINFSPKMTQEWKIESVPCIVKVQRGQPPVKRYRMQAVDELYRFIQEDEVKNL
ncbi:thioredoxin family protein [Paenibacillus silviterrae]|uniref:thioredoxin family protein n=1 Tax=Paenibacillus silviterrae TaxID=3242194 RepID=UPI0025428202|nr:thioredoxin family protein [Paenibacillus chinjuensis]